MTKVGATTAGSGLKVSTPIPESTAGEELSRRGALASQMIETLEKHIEAQVKKREAAILVYATAVALLFGWENGGGKVQPDLSVYVSVVGVGVLAISITLRRWHWIYFQCACVLRRALVLDSTVSGTLLIHLWKVRTKELPTLSVLSPLQGTETAGLFLTTLALSVPLRNALNAWSPSGDLNWLSTFLAAWVLVGLALLATMKSASEPDASHWPLWPFLPSDGEIEKLLDAPNGPSDIKMDS